MALCLLSMGVCTSCTQPSSPGAAVIFPQEKQPGKAVLTEQNGEFTLSNDYKLMNEINGGALWKDLADCIAWQEANADVLPDIHWVGGNPWDGKQANIYGWAAWNAKKAVLTRN